MAKVTTELKVLVKTAGDAGLDKLTRTLNGLGRQAKSAAAPFDQISKELKEVQRTSKNSIANLRGYRNAWRDITQQVEIGSDAFREATAEAARLDKQLQKAEGRKGPGRGGRLRAAAQVAGTVAGAGVFGGPEGAAGALLGSIAGPGGAIVGGAIGAQVGQFRQALGASAEYAASIAKLRIALKGVTTSQTDYNNALDFVQQATTKFAIPQEIVTRQFTKLQASVQGAGGNLEDTKTAFNGIVASVRATGGSLQDIDSALAATAQVFSKGKVSAEELRQQIGERLPGAFTLFAKSLGKTPQELDKSLEKGEVSLQDFQTFAEEIFKKYGKTAEIIASSPEAAGDRLAVALSNMNESVGRLLTPIGTAFQTVFTAILEQITDAADALDRFLGVSDDARIAVLTKQVTASNLKLAAINADIRREQQARPEADLLGGAGAQGGGLGGLLLEQQQAIQTRNVASKELDNLRAMMKMRGEIEQSKPGGGLPGIVLTPPPSTERIDASQTLLGLAEKLNEARKSGNNFAVVSAQLAFDRQKIEESTLLPREKNIRLLNLDAKTNEKILRLLSGKPAKIKDLNNELTETQKLFGSIKDTVATGLTNAIMGLIDGTKSLGESLSGVLKQIGSLFLRAGIGSFGVGGEKGTGLLGALFSAKGNVFAHNNVVPFAYGGVVNKPTVFPMANGMGVMGEAGPEAIMPLKRGRGGRLGVEVASQDTAREAMSRYSRGSGNSAASLMTGGQESEGNGSASNAVLDVNYSVERINNINYVTAAEFEKGMAQAAKRGAEMGKRGVYSELVNKRSVRSRIGV